MGTPPRLVYANAAATAVFGADLAARLRAPGCAAARDLRATLLRQRGGSAPRLERLAIDLGGGVETITLLCRRLFETDDGACYAIAALGLRGARRPATAPRAEPRAPASQGFTPDEVSTPGEVLTPGDVLAPAGEVLTPVGEVLAPVGEVLAPVGEVLAPVEAKAREAASAVAAALGAERSEAGDSDAAHSDAEHLEPRARLAERHGSSAPRFLWKTDAAGRFVDVTHVLSDVAGAKYADLLGRDVEEVSRAMGLGPAFAAALAARKSWSGVVVDWPVEQPDCRVPTTLGALPIVDARRGFLGFQGFGVLRLSRAKQPPRDEKQPTDAADAAPRDKPEPPVQEPPALEPVQDALVSEAPASEVGNVVTLRPPPARESGAALTPVERSAFDEIARALGETTENNGARDLIDQVTRAIETPDDADERRAGTLVELLPVGVLVARGAKALYANRTLLDFLGYGDLDALEADGGLARMFLGRLPGRAPAPPAALEVQARDGETLDVDAHVQSIDWSGGPATLISLRRVRENARTRIEIEALRAKEAENARLRGENEALKSCFDASAAAAIIDGAGRVARANAGFAALTGEDARLHAGRELASLLVDADAARLAAVLAEDSDSLASDAVFTMKNKAATRLSLRRLGPSRHVAEVVAEVAPPSASESARLEAERASAAKSDFLARVSHEIRTPLNAIIGFAEVMMEERFGPIGCDRYKEYLKDVHTSGTHVLSLVNDLLDLSKIEAGKMELAPEQIDVNTIIGECVSIMQTQANQQRVIMRLSLAPRLPRVRADERSLRQILLNLLSNAVKFNEPGGQVIVSSTQTDTGFVIIRVKDTGIGMSEEEIEIALEPFRQIATTRKTSGTGLGLPVTKALIEANHASFIIKSRKNEGTLIEVAFPPSQSLAAE